jgi:hypothetical protein
MHFYAITSQTRACIRFKNTFSLILSPHTTKNAVHGNFKNFIYTMRRFWMQIRKWFHAWSSGEEKYEGLWKVYMALFSRIRSTDDPPSSVVWKQEQINIFGHACKYAKMQKKKNYLQITNFSWRLASHIDFPTDLISTQICKFNIDPMT